MPLARHDAVRPRSVDEDDRAVRCVRQWTESHGGLRRRLRMRLEVVDRVPAGRRSSALGALTRLTFLTPMNDEQRDDHQQQDEHDQVAEPPVQADARSALRPARSARRSARTRAARRRRRTAPTPTPAFFTEERSSSFASSISPRMIVEIDSDASWTSWPIDGSAGLPAAPRRWRFRVTVTVLCSSHARWVLRIPILAAPAVATRIRSAAGGSAARCRRGCRGRCTRPIPGPAAKPPLSPLVMSWKPAAAAAGGGAGVQRVDEPVQQPAGGLRQPRDQRRPQRCDRARAADDDGRAVDQHLVAGLRVGVAGDVGHAAAGAGHAGVRLPLAGGRRCR